MCSPLIADLVIVFGFRVGDLAMVFREWQHNHTMVFGSASKFVS
jgi:hypothetical protein